MNRAKKRAIEISDKFIDDERVLRLVEQIEVHITKQTVVEECDRSTADGCDVST